MSPPGYFLFEESSERAGWPFSRPKVSRGEGGVQQETMTSLVGLILAEPGQPAGAQLVVDLAWGRSYTFPCVLRDAPDKPPHVTLGMAKILLVK